MNGTLIAFWIFGLGILFGAAVVAFSRNLIHAALGLFLTLFAVAGIFILSYADFLGIIQLIVYIGGILILILFGVMLTRKNLDNRLPSGRINTWMGTALVTGMAGVLVLALLPGNYDAGFSGEPIASQSGSTVGIGIQTLTAYVLPFEAVSILLLTTLAGAAWLARRAPAQPRNLLKDKPDLNLNGNGSNP